MQPCSRLVGMDRGTRRDTAKDRGKGKVNGKGKSKRKKGERREKGKGNSGKGNGGWWNVQREQRWTEPFRGYCGHCWKCGHKKAQCHQCQGRRPMELCVKVSNPSQSVVSDPGSSVSQRVQAVNSFPVPAVCWSTAAVDVDEDWPEEWCYDWETGTKNGLGTIQSEWHDNEGSDLVCGAAGSTVVRRAHILVWTLRKTTQETIQKGRSCGSPRIRKLKHTPG